MGCNCSKTFIGVPAGMAMRRCARRRVSTLEQDPLLCGMVAAAAPPNVWTNIVVPNTPPSEVSTNIVGATAPPPYVCANVGPAPVSSGPLLRDQALMRVTPDPYALDKKCWNGMKIGQYTKGEGSYVALYLRFKKNKYLPRFADDDWTFTVCSTAESARADKHGDRLSYLKAKVWYGHENETLFPRTTASAEGGCVGEVFPTSVNPPPSLMELLQSEGIEYQFAWSGYHIHQTVESTVNREYCPVDIYIWKGGDTFHHWIASDIVAPCMAHEAVQTWYQGEVEYEDMYF